MPMHELLDAAGATLCDPLLIILLAVMMMPSGGSSYVFSGKTDDATGSVPCVAGKRPLDLPFGVVAKGLYPLPLHLSPCSREY